MRPSALRRRLRRARARLRRPRLRRVLRVVKRLRLRRRASWGRSGRASTHSKKIPSKPSPECASACSPTTPGSRATAAPRSTCSPRRRHGRGCHPFKALLSRARHPRRARREGLGLRRREDGPPRPLALRRHAGVAAAAPRGPRRPRRRRRGPAGRGLPLLHVPHDARLRPRGGREGEGQGRRPRPAEPDPGGRHGRAARRRRRAHVRRVPRHPDPHRNDDRRARRASSTPSGRSART